MAKGAEAIPELLSRLAECEHVPRLLARMDPSSPSVLEALSVAIVGRDIDSALLSLRVLERFGASGHRIASSVEPGLRNADPIVRAVSAELIGRFAGGEQPSPHVEPLLARLDDESWMVRYEVALALGRLANPSAAVEEALQNLDADSSPRVRSAARTVLGWLDDSAADESEIAL